MQQCQVLVANIRVANIRANENDIYVSKNGMLHLQI